MAAPIIEWYDQTNTFQETQWQIGTVDAGSISPDTTFLIWNNRGRSEAVSDMTNCTITTKDILGGNTGEVVEDLWIEARLNSIPNDDFEKIGGTIVKPIQSAAGVTGQISGAANDGTKENASSNFAEVTVRANVPATATAGNFSFLLRVQYQYV